MHRTLIFFAILLLASCASDDLRPRDEDLPRQTARRAPARDIGADVSLPDGWWRDPSLAEPLALSSEQFQRLDALQPRYDELERIERDAMIAARDFRTALESRDAAAADIAAAGKRVREMGDAVSGRQIELVIAQREILTTEQWHLLHRELQEERMERRSMRPGRGGVGPRGGRGGGRRPW